MKKITTISLLVVLGLTVLTSATLADYGSKKKYSLAGVVKENNTLNPLSGVKVKLYTSSYRYKKYSDTDTTSLSGKYKFSDLEKGTYTLKVTKNGYRNPRDVKKDSVTKVVKVDKSKRSNLYLQKI